MLIIFLLLGVLAGILVLLMAPLQVKVFYRRKEQNDYMCLEVHFFWGVLPVRLELPFMDVPPDIEEPAFKIKGKLTTRTKKPIASSEKKLHPGKLFRVPGNNLEYYRLLKPHLQRLLKNTRVVKFRWHTEMGVADAAFTGLLAGALWTVKGLAASVIYQFTGQQEKMPQLAFKPVYNRNYLSTELDCIFKTRPGHIIITAGKVILVFWKKKRQDYRGEKNARTAASH